MPNRDQTVERSAATSTAADAARWVTPGVEVISLSCEITAYAPDGEPLF